MNDAGTGIQNLQRQLDDEQRGLFEHRRKVEQLGQEKQKLLSERELIEKRLQMIKHEEDIEFNKGRGLENEVMRNKTALRKLVEEQSVHKAPPSHGF